MRKFLTLSVLFLTLAVWAKEVIPAKPDRYFNDYAGLVPEALGKTLNKELEDLEKQTSSQFVVAIYPKMETDSSIEDYTVRVARAWKVGQTNKNNGVVMFVFADDRKMRIEVGYGLEAVLPDITCKRIISDVMAPSFKAERYDKGVIDGVNAVIAAVREGQYVGTGGTVDSSNPNAPGTNPQDILLIVIVGFFLFIYIASLFSSKGSRGGWMVSSGGFGGWTGGGGGGWGGGGGGGGGGFSGGGGSFGGGGASGSW